MNVAAKRGMTVPQYLQWAMTQPQGRYELVDGEIVKMSPEGARHVRVKAAAWLALTKAIKKSALPCEAFADGMTVVIDEHKTREPDASVQCTPVDPESIVLDRPLIVVEVLSPSSGRTDTTEKLADYFAVSSVQHYLIVNPIRRHVIHHARSPTGAIDARTATSGEIVLAPPGLTVTVEEILGEIER